MTNKAIERVAWSALAELFRQRNARLSANNDVAVYRGGRGFHGLCPALMLMELPFEIEDAMKQKIKKHSKPDKVYGFLLAPFTFEGMKIRAAFCRKMAKELK